MNKGITFYWGFEEKPEKRAKVLKDIGFDCVMTSPDKKFDKQNGSIHKQVRLFKQFGLKLSSLHMQYIAEELPYFWLKCPKGNRLEKRLIQDIKIAAKYGFPYVVAHMVGMPSQVGLDRLKRVLSFCEKVNVSLAIENLDYNDCFYYTFDNLKHPNLKYCCDIGHVNIFDKHIDFLDKYGDKLICLHLHDNDGVNDLHTLNRYGTINWDEIAKKLAKVNFTGSLDYEIKTCADLDMIQGTKEVYKQACELDKLINKYKRQYSKNNKK